MKSVFFNLFFTVLTIGVTAQTSIMTYNIRYAEPNDGDNYWEVRKPEVAQLIQYYQPDILGLQEVLRPQLDYLRNALPDYRYVGVGRDDGKLAGEYTPIFYRSAKFKLIRTHTYWLSETPEKPTMGWDAATMRVVTYAILKERATGQHYAVFNTHLDYKGETARQESAKLILNLLEEMQWGESPVIVIGDFNAEPTTEAITIFKSNLSDAYENTKQPSYGPYGTYNRFELDHKLDRRIDYIFTKNVIVNSHRHIDDHRDNGLWISDHLPVFVEVSSEQ